ncbi:MAG: hypothetical protein NC132_04820 [Corallococcus sp.]|nr:hypothetical protein [Corallococcus sp.]MCM1359710.1 hypothetical protein [Corallococcus sp.]MCM1395419.1 hypothetical protein [Corallococcus sp.]
MSIKKAFAKIKSVKNIELYLALAFALIAVVVILALSGGFSKNDTQNQDVANFNEYISYMENKLTSVIGQMDGCKNVKVAVSCAVAEEKIYAYDKETTVVGGKETITETLVTVSGKPLVVKTLPPEIYGVVVVAEGANDPVTKYKIIQAVVTLLDTSADKVQVFTYKS